MKFKNQNTLINTVLFLTAIGLSVCLLFFVILSSWIGYEVKNQCRDAQQVYAEEGKKNCVELLTQLLMDEGKDLRRRNDAIWALGQLGDNRALPVLQKYYTGDIPEREPLDKVISQYELKKAINLAGGGFNITAFIWRRNLL